MDESEFSGTTPIQLAAAAFELLNEHLNKTFQEVYKELPEGQKQCIEMIVYKWYWGNGLSYRTMNRYDYMNEPFDFIVSAIRFYINHPEEFKLKDDFAHTMTIIKLEDILCSVFEKHTKWNKSLIDECYYALQLRFLNQGGFNLFKVSDNEARKHFCEMYTSIVKENHNVFRNFPQLAKLSVRFVKKGPII